jgi:hypothetical protein
MWDGVRFICFAFFFYTVRPELVSNVRLIVFAWPAEVVAQLRNARDFTRLLLDVLSTLFPECLLDGGFDGAKVDAYMKALLRSTKLA